MIDLHKAVLEEFAEAAGKRHWIRLYEYGELSLRWTNSPGHIGFGRGPDITYRPRKMPEQKGKGMLRPAAEYQDKTNIPEWARALLNG